MNERNDEQTIKVSALYIIFNDYSKFPEPRLVDQDELIWGEELEINQDAMILGEELDINQHTLIRGNKLDLRKQNISLSICDI